MLQTKLRLHDVDLIRPILIVLLVVYHSFAVYDGKWEPFEGYIDNGLYKLISRLFSFRLEALVFISGYVWGFRTGELGKIQSFWEVLKSKAKRLMLPSILFSIPYILFLDKEDGCFWEKIVLGAGHLWFLPMLFCCFILCYIIFSIKIKERLKVLFLLGLAIISYIPMPFNISKVSYFILFFYIGFLINYKNRQFRVVDYNIYFLWFLHIILWILIDVSMNTLYSHKAWYHILMKILQITYSITGIMALFLTAQHYLNRHEVPQTFVWMCSYCYGIYICHQFVLRILYYKTSLSTTVDSLLLPWIGFVIALSVSIFCTHIFRQSRFGRYLIG